RSRRHTRFSRDWSSDVCSSDLIKWLEPKAQVKAVTAGRRHSRILKTLRPRCSRISRFGIHVFNVLGNDRQVTTYKRYHHLLERQIGRASCRDRALNEDRAAK